MHFLQNSLRRPQEVEVAVYFGMSGFKRHKAPQNLGTTMALGLEREMGSHGWVCFSQCFCKTRQWGFLFVCSLLWYPVMVVSGLGDRRSLRQLWACWCGVLPFAQQTLTWAPKQHSRISAGGWTPTGDPAGMRWDAGSYPCTASSSGHSCSSPSWRIFHHCAVNWCRQAQSLPLPTVLEVLSILMNYLSYLEAGEGYTVPCEGVLAVPEAR